MKNKKFSVGIYFLLSFIYLEFLYRLLLYENVFAITNINMILFLLFFSCIISILSKLYKDKGNKAIFFCILIFFGIWFSAQYIVKDVFDFYISFSILKIADQVGGFFLKQTIIEVLKRIFYIVLFFIPVIFAILFNKKISFKKNKLKKNILCLIISVLLFLCYYLGLNINKNNVYSAYNLYHKVNDPAINIEKVGVINAGCMDIYRLIFGFEEKLVISSSGNIENVEEVETEYEYNNLNVDFESFSNETTDETFKTMNNYFASNTGTKQNEYTGYFEGKNLIYIMAESFNEIAVSEKLTPTLYKLVNGGFSFQNFYSQTIGSTIGGEFQLLTGLYANTTSFATFRTGNNSFPMGIGTMFKNKGYSTYAYHDHYYTFQDRNIYLKSLGFDNFKGCYNGLEKSINCNLWPESDVEMINATIDDYINSENPFMVFYATVSGHGGYSWSGNNMSKKHREEVENAGLNYSEDVLAYIAAQMELDDALEVLLQKLDEAGKLDDTVIVLAGDHYPYMLTIDKINEVSNYQKDEVIEVNHSNLIIYNSKMETVNVNKVVSQMDILPTVYNLFNIKYDSRLLIGTDALSSSQGLAIFANRSWISDKGKYYSSTSKFESTNEVDENYIELMNQEVNNKINMSKYIIDKNYYKYIWNYIK